jgi:putative PEP-CTERM system histidine kinase
MIDTNEIGAFGYAVALIVYALLTILLLSGWQRNSQSRLPALATAISLVWAGVWIAGFLDLTREYALVATVEWARGLSWLVALVAILREFGPVRLGHQLRSAYGVGFLLLAGAPSTYFLIRADEPAAMVVWVTGSFILSLCTVLVAEQLFRNAPVDSRSSITYLCIAIAGVFLFDLVIYGFVIAGATTGPEFWAARGFVNAMFAAPLALGTWRRSHLTPAAQVPRQIAFYSFGITIIALYVVLLIVGHHFVMTYGGSWAEVGGIVLIVGAIGSAAVLLGSDRMRARVRVFLMKTFLQYKYDYRKEWLRFVSTLSQSGLEDVGATAVRAVAQIVNSPGGVVWIREHQSNYYVPSGSWRCEIPSTPPIPDDSGLIRFLQDRRWVIDFQEMYRHPERYENLKLDSWLPEDNEWWLVVPLFPGKQLYGFITLKAPRAIRGLNFEDHDLLRTVGGHAGMHINQAESDKRLAESRQFGAYNRLTAFLMHDLNNLIAQQSLVVTNAERFRDNPKFVDDAIDTIAHSVERMKQLMEQLSRGSKAPAARLTDLRDAVKTAIDRCQSREPVPSVDLGDSPIELVADPERLTTVFEHIVKNAQESTDRSGHVLVKLSVAGNSALVSIQDDGHGMSTEFIRERLFRPFESTKGSNSMGIGAYQAREYVRALGGQIDVTSEIGTGTEFIVHLPCSN